MDQRPWLRRVWEWLLHFGAYPEETLEQRAKRRLFLVAGWIASIPRPEKCCVLPRLSDSNSGSNS